MVMDQGTPCIPPSRNRNQRVTDSKRLYNMGHKVERLLARLKDWCPIATRYDRCGSIFRTAILLADNVVVWL